MCELYLGNMGDPCGKHKHTCSIVSPVGVSALLPLLSPGHSSIFNDVSAKGSIPSVPSPQLTA